MVNNVSSINANANWLNASAVNIANVTTKDYKPIDTTIVDKGFAPSANFSISDNSGTNLAKEFADQIVLLGGTSANVKAIDTQDEITKTILDIKA